ncbi:hypothetical protein COEREDRAFT_87863 [Coemansia reversa NRRL 1564]|uniref:Uncharacterized protein n=1 Tax=Coemansia reversa (strain ATCC 12441 / NRRL 1564) TaxID=763665 RepID=A0A2G5B8Y3_COERN|nr:hypothetical protein COEREDRAFT_87863 [Coemansia reversa NRRL 1564]|eukprot:PIA15450.1 hypothetical protein COEREDRAFT_87863 [Coemansia reversa NRRL 1564]
MADPYTTYNCFASDSTSNEPKLVWFIYRILLDDGREWSMTKESPITAEELREEFLNDSANNSYVDHCIKQLKGKVDLFMCHWLSSYEYSAFDEKKFEDLPNEELGENRANAKENDICYFYCRAFPKVEDPGKSENPPRSAD